MKLVSVSEDRDNDEATLFSEVNCPVVSAYEVRSVS